MNYLTAFSRHIPTIVILIGAMWWIITPRAEQFIEKTLDLRISVIERDLNSQNSQLREIIRRLDRIERKYND